MYEQYKFTKTVFEHKYSNHPLKIKSTFSRHMHNEYEILHILSGNVDYYIDGISVPLNKGDIIFIPSRSFHFADIRGDEPYERMIISFLTVPNDDSLAKTIFSSPKKINKMSAPQIAQVFTRIADYQTVFKGDIFATLLCGALYEILHVAAINKLDDFNTDSATKSDFIRLLSYINEHLTTIKSVDELARANYINITYVYQLFQQELHVSPKKFITIKRLLLARTRIGTGEHPTKIFEECGFDNYCTFFRSYKSYFKNAPYHDLPSRK